MRTFRLTKILSKSVLIKKLHFIWYINIAFYYYLGQIIEEWIK